MFSAGDGRSRGCGLAMDDFHAYNDNCLDYMCGFVRCFSEFIRRKMAASELVLCLTIHVVCNMRMLALEAPGVEKHRAQGLV